MKFQRNLTIFGGYIQEFFSIIFTKQQVCQILAANRIVRFMNFFTEKKKMWFSLGKIRHNQTIFREYVKDLLLHIYTKQQVCRSDTCGKIAIFNNFFQRKEKKCNFHWEKFPAIWQFFAYTLKSSSSTYSLSILITIDFGLFVLFLRASKCTVFKID